MPLAKKKQKYADMVSRLLAGSKRQKYVVRCHTKVACSKMGLCEYPKGYYNPEDMLTDEGYPTRKLENACVYTNNHDDEFPWEDARDNDEDLERYFEPVLIDTKIVIRKPSK